MTQWCRTLVYLFLAWALGACPAQADAPMRICGPPVAESLVFAVMAQKGLAPVAFIPWNSPDQARAMIAGKRVDAAIVTTSAAATFLAKGVDVRIAGVFDSPLWVVSSRDRAKGMPLDGVLLFPFGHREMPELLFDIVFGRPCPDLETRHTGGALEAVNFMLLGRAHHALLAEPAATLAVLRSEKAGGSGLVKHLDIRQVWKDKFRGMPLYVSALAVFGPAPGNRERIRDVVMAYADARQWVGDHPHKALALAGKAAPALAAQMPDAGRFKPAGQLSDRSADFDAAFFFLNRIHDRFPAAVGNSRPVETLFMGEK